MEKGELNSIKQIITSPGWALIVGELKEKIEEVEERIFEIEKEDNVVIYTMKDLMRVDREAYKKLTELPTEILNSHGVTEIGISS